MWVHFRELFFLSIFVAENSIDLEMWKEDYTRKSLFRLIRKVFAFSFFFFFFFFFHAVKYYSLVYRVIHLETTEQVIVSTFCEFHEAKCGLSKV